jgi:hypothetical protein
MEARNNSCTTHLQGITKIRTHRAMKDQRKALHELTPHIPKKSTEGNIHRPPKYSLPTSITALID